MMMTGNEMLGRNESSIPGSSNPWLDKHGQTDAQAGFSLNFSKEPVIEGSIWSIIQG